MAREWTFLFTDIQESTPLWERFPEEMNVALARHDTLARQVIESHGGRIFQHSGDGVNAAFEDPVASVVAASALQQAIRPSAATDVALRVRIGLHSGPALERDGNFFGPTLNRVARLMSAAYGDQILVSEQVRQTVVGTLPTHFSFVDLGAHRFRGIDGTTHVFQLIDPHLPASFPPLATHEGSPTNLPAQTTSFIGRSDDVETLARLLNDHRLVTVTGPAGTGKTRLAIEVATELADQYEHGCWFVDVSTSDSRSDLEENLATVLRIPSHRDIDGFIRGRRVLIVLDNCEHLVEAAAAVAERLTSAGGVAILATSREPFDLPGEVVYGLQPLPVEANGTMSPAATLFMDRARAAAPEFEPTPRDEPRVEAICARLDGLPLAIELLAPRVGSLGLDELARSWTDHLGSARSRQARHHTIGEAIDWSYESLQEHEQVAFAACAVFPAGFGLDDVVGVISDATTSRPAMVSVMASLVHKSMLIADWSSGGIRYRMLETLRRYGVEKLSEERAEDLRDRHMRHYAAYAGEAQRGLRGSDSRDWVRRIDVDIANFRSAMTRAMSADHLSDGLQISRALLWFSTGLGRLATTRAWHEAVLARRAELPPEALLAALNGAGVIAFSESEYARASEIAAEAIEVARARHDDDELAVALTLAGSAASFQGNALLAYQCFEESLALCVRLGDEWGLAWALAFRGITARMSGDLDAAEPWLLEAIAKFETFAISTPLTLPEINLAMVHRHRGRLDEARALCQSARRHAGAHPGMLSAAEGFAGRIELAANAIDDAQGHFVESLRLAEEGESQVMVAIAVEGLATVASRRAHDEMAAVLFGFAAGFRRSIGSIVPTSERADHDRTLVALEERLGDAFPRALERGRALSLADIDALVL